MSTISLVVFTCHGREHLLEKTWASFTKACTYPFDQVILAIDGVVDPAIIAMINPDQVIYGYKRKGYVISIKHTLAHINTEYFFWLEDDWSFHAAVDVPYYLNFFDQNRDWAEIVYSKHGPLPEYLKEQSLGNNFYINDGYSANPGYNRTALIKEGFIQMESAKRKDGEREIGFENFLTACFAQKHIKNVIVDPVNGTVISHEGYLESTPRSWHMMTSLDKRTEKHLLTIPEPSFIRRLYMLLKLAFAFGKLGLNQLVNNKVYEFCFRIIASAQNLKKE